MNSQLEIKLAPTPETDAMEYFDAMCDPDRVVEADFARKLERERDEAQETIATMEIRHAAVMLHTQSIVDDANQCREQRDRLAEALRNLCDEFLGNKSSRDITAQLLEARKALQSLNQPTKP